MINESGLDGILTHIEGNKDFAILTAYRAETDADLNRRQNTVLCGHIQKTGCGFLHLDGHFVENEGTPGEVNIAEDSLLVISNGDTAFKKKMIEAAKAFNQDSIVIKSCDEIYFVTVATGEKYNIGKYSPEKIGEYFSALKTVGDRKFVFENVRYEKNNLAKYVEEVARKRMPD